MRTGEVFGLTWNDIDLENRIIKVNKTVYSKPKDDTARWFLGTTKTEGSCREISICNTLYKALSNYKKKQKLSYSKYLNKNCYDVALDIFSDTLKILILNDKLIRSKDIPQEIDDMMISKFSK